MSKATIKNFLTGELPFAFEAGVQDQVINNEIQVALGIDPTTYDNTQPPIFLDRHIANRCCIVLIQRAMIREETTGLGERGSGSRPDLEALIERYRDAVRRYEVCTKPKNATLSWKGERV